MPSKKKRSKQPKKSVAPPPTKKSVAPPPAPAATAFAPPPPWSRTGPPAAAAGGPHHRMPTMADVASVQDMWNNPHEVAAMMSDPNCLPPHLANHPMMAELQNMARDPHMVAKMSEMGRKLSPEQVAAMLSQKLELKEDKKVQLQGAKLFDGSTACWVCLDNAPDEDGNPLVRDCACRGTAGYAHLSCIKQYAKSRSNHLDGMMYVGNFGFIEHWSKCPHCLQSYAGELAIALSDACLTQYDNIHNLETYAIVNSRPAVKMLVNLVRINIMLFKLDALTAMRVASHVPGGQSSQRSAARAKQAGEEILSLFDQMEAWNRMDKICSSNNVVVPNNAAVDACQRLCQVYSLEPGTEAEEKVMEYNKKAIALCKKAGRNEMARQLEVIGKSCSARYSRKHRGIRTEEEYKQSELMIPDARETYAKLIKSDGEAFSIDAGKNLALVLHKSGYTIETERLVVELLSTIKRVLGSGHRSGHELEQQLKECRLRIVVIPCGDGFKRMAVDGYKAGGSKYMMHCMESGERYSCDCDDEDVLLQPGTPVVCKGLKGAAQLNDKIGDIRGRDKKTGRYAVHFSDESLKPASAYVKKSNLRIVIQLPDGNKCVGDSHLVFCE